MNLEQFKSKIEAFIAKKGMTPTAFGKMYANDPGFVFDLRERDREPREATRAKVLEAMSSERAA